MKNTFVAIVILICSFLFAGLIRVGVKNATIDKLSTPSISSITKEQYVAGAISNNPSIEPAVVQCLYEQMIDYYGVEEVYELDKALVADNTENIMQSMVDEYIYIAEKCINTQ